MPPPDAQGQEPEQNGGCEKVEPSTTECAKTIWEGDCGISGLQEPLTTFSFTDEVGASEKLGALPQEKQS